MPEEKPPPGLPNPEEEHDIEYLICRQCGTPCYVFQMDRGRLIEAFCSICGNEDVILFTVTEDEDE